MTQQNNNRLVLTHQATQEQRQTGCLLRVCLFPLYHNLSRGGNS